MGLSAHRRTTNISKIEGRNSITKVWETVLWTNDDSKRGSQSLGGRNSACADFGSDSRRNQKNKIKRVATDTEALADGLT